MKNLLLVISLFFAVAVNAQQTPSPEQNRSILIIGGTAHLGTGDVIVDSAIGFREGKIDYVGRAFQVDKANTTDIIDATGKHIYQDL